MPPTVDDLALELAAIRQQLRLMETVLRQVAELLRTVAGKPLKPEA